MKTIRHEMDRRIKHLHISIVALILIVLLCGYCAHKLEQSKQPDIINKTAK